MPFGSQNNFGDLKPKVFLEPIKEWSIFKGDRVSIENIIVINNTTEIQIKYLCILL